MKEEKLGNVIAKEIVLASGRLQHLPILPSQRVVESKIIIEEAVGNILKAVKDNRAKSTS